MNNSNNNSDSKGNTSIEKRNDSLMNFPDLDAVERFANHIKNSKEFAKAFEKKVDDGNGNEITVVETSDIIAAVILGREMGIPPMASVMLGKKLNKNSFFSVIKGRSLGLDPVTAIENIHNIPTQNGDMTYTGVHIISSKLIEAGVIFTPFIKDFSPLYEYTDTKTKKVIPNDIILDENDNVKDSYYVVTSASTKEEVTQAQSENKIVVTRVEVSKYTKARFIRKDRNGNIIHNLTISYSLKDAQDAGLYAIYDANGREIQKGKGNWNNHPATMLRNRVIAIGGRIVAADYLQGIYLKEEAEEIAGIDETVDDFNAEDITEQINNPS